MWDGWGGGGRRQDVGDDGEEAFEGCREGLYVTPGAAEGVTAGCGGVRGEGWEKFRGNLTGCKVVCVP